MVKGMINWKEEWSFEAPQGTEISEIKGLVKVKGKLGEVTRNMLDNYVRVSVQGRKVTILSSKNNKRTKGIVGTWASEIRNMFQGVQSGFEYEMKIDYTHFPMRVSVRGSNVVIDNFLGERSARTASIIGNSKVSVKGDRVFISGIDKRELGETAANVERATKIKGFDLRVFQDGIYLL